MDNITANFFWLKGDLNLYAKICIKSFIDKGFNVNLWTYDSNFNTDLNVTIKNANELISFEEVRNIKQGNYSECESGISNIIRYYICKDPNAWYFDTDIVCIKNAEEFNILKNNRGLVVSFETHDRVNGAVISIADSNICNDFINRSKKILIDNNNEIKWGQIGPGLITDYVYEKGLIQSVLPKIYFYPITFYEVELFFTNKPIQNFESVYCVHLWNECLKLKGINTNTLPDKNTILYKLFEKYI